MVTCDHLIAEIKKVAHSANDGQKFPRVTYDADGDVLYVAFKDEAADRSTEANGVVRRCDEWGELIGLTFIDFIERHRQPLTVLERQERQPIETAPKDGTHILGCWTTGEMDVIYHSPGGTRGREWCDEEGFVSTPPHWQPLPAPPVIAEHGQNDDGTARGTASPSPETTLHADMLALIKDLQARGLTTTEDHERVMSILERAGG